MRKSGRHSPYKKEGDGQPRTTHHEQQFQHEPFRQARAIGSRYGMLLIVRPAPAVDGREHATGRKFHRRDVPVTTRHVLWREFT